LLTHNTTWRYLFKVLTLLISGISKVKSPLAETEEDTPDFIGYLKQPNAIRGVSMRTPAINYGE